MSIENKKMTKNWESMFFNYNVVYWDRLVNANVGIIFVSKCDRFCQK